MSEHEQAIEVWRKAYIKVLTERDTLTRCLKQSQDAAIALAKKLRRVEAQLEKRTIANYLVNEAIDKEIQ